MTEKKYKNKGWLEQKYIVEDLTQREIGDICGVHQKTICRWCGKHGLTDYGVHRVCEECGDEFYLRPEHANADDRGKYCSVKCKAAAQTNNIKYECECEECGNTVVIEVPAIKRRDYGYRWPEIREEIIERDDEQCQECGKHREECDRNLHVHHIIPWVEFGDTAYERNQKAHYPSNLTTLCASCHAELER